LVKVIALSGRPRVARWLAVLQTAPWSVVVVMALILRGMLGVLGVTWYIIYQ
jgi:hypothetical protein